MLLHCSHVLTNLCHLHYFFLLSSLMYDIDVDVRRSFSCRQLLLASEIMVCIGIILSFHTLIPYSVPQYVCSALITFVSAEILEGNNVVS